VKYYVGIILQRLLREPFFTCTFACVGGVGRDARFSLFCLLREKQRERDILIKTFESYFRSREGRRDSVVPPPARDFSSWLTKIAPLSHLFVDTLLTLLNVHPLIDSANHASDNICSCPCCVHNFASRLGTSSSFPGGFRFSFGQNLCIRPSARYGESPIPSNHHFNTRGRGLARMDERSRR
jgi:hypothetical protein